MNESKTRFIHSRLASILGKLSSTTNNLNLKNIIIVQVLSARNPNEHIHVIDKSTVRSLIEEKKEGKRVRLIQ